MSEREETRDEYLEREMQHEIEQQARYALDMANRLAATPEPAPEPVSNAYTLPEEVREAATAFRRVNAAQRDDSCTDAGCIVCKRREAGERLLAALDAAVRGEK